ncbi:uncharacterized protein LOC115993976 isoform X2 [Quercus lobata]|nr:uncharacterized protein LOC115993976 isoform X2 [Quercus lobata]
MSSYEKKTKTKTINKTTRNIPHQQMPTTRGTRGTNEKCTSVEAWSPPYMDGKSKTTNKTTQNVTQQQILTTRDKKQTESKPINTPQQQQQEILTRGTNEKCTTSVENWSPYMEGIMPEKPEHMSPEMEFHFRRAFHHFVDDFLYNPNRTTRRLPIFEQQCQEEK